MHDRDLLADAHLIRTTTGAVYIAIEAVDAGGGSCYLWSPDQPEGVSYVPWCDRWETAPLPADSLDVMRARAAVTAHHDRVAARNARWDAERAARASPRTHDEEDAAAYAVPRRTALTRVDLIARGWTIGLIRKWLCVDGFDFLTFCDGSGGGKRYLYGSAEVTYREGLLQPELTRIKQRRSRKAEKK